MAKLRALSYSRFIQVMCLMGAYLAPEQNGTFMIYQSSGTGYFPVPRGPQCAFKARAADELVTVREIETVLAHMFYKVSVFVEIEAACQIPEDPSSGIPISPQK
jgi:hypothetical protein